MMDVKPDELARRIMRKLHENALLVGLRDDRVARIADCIELTLYRNAAANQENDHA